MDYKLSAIIKKEKKETHEDNNDFSKLCFDIDIKVDPDRNIDDWCIKKVLSDYQEARICQKLEKDSQMCGVCNKYFPDSHSLYKHNLLHIKVPLIKHKFFICDTCHRFYTKKNFLIKHIIMKHRPQNQKRFIGVTKTQCICRICYKTYSYETWYDHLKTVHGGAIWECEVCGAVFQYERYLKRHVMCKHQDLSSMSERKWECPKCPSKFRHKSCVTTHLRNCHSEKTFSCNICNTILKSKRYLSKHMNRVHYYDGMVHSCNVCGKIFKSPEYLKVHVKNIHSSKALNK